MTEKILRISREIRQRFWETGFFTFVVLLTTALAGGYYYFLWHRTNLRAETEELATYRRKIEQSPYDGPLLLRAARHHYQGIRDRLRRGADVSGSVRSLIVQALSFYRRLSSNRSWELAPEDYFRMAYLYYKLGPSYLNRTREVALEAHQQGYRSPELVTLLANTNHRLSRHEKALEYYESLGASIRDPVVLFNWAVSLREAGGEKRLRRALELLGRGRSLLSDYEGEVETLRQEYRLALARVNLDLGKVKKAEQIIRRQDNWRLKLDFKLLYAEVLLEAGRRDETRKLLQEIVERDDSPERARVLLDKLEFSGDESGPGEN